MTTQTWDMDTFVDPIDFTKHYPKECWETYGAKPGAIFYLTPGNVYYWSFAQGAEDAHKVWVPKNKTIVTSNRKWAVGLKECGYTVNLRQLIAM